MDDYIRELDACIIDQIPSYLRVWVDEVTVEFETSRPNVLTRSVAAIAKKLHKLEMLKPHCLTYGEHFDTPELVKQHLLTCSKCNNVRRNRKDRRCPPELKVKHTYPHIYSLKVFKEEVERVKELIEDVNDFAANDEITSKVLVLRMGIALKVATLVKLNRSQEFEDQVNDIIDGF
jgi:hypothetical protein